MTTTLETSNQKQATDLKSLATDVVSRAMKSGATATECVVREGDEFSTVVRLGQVETLKESGSKAIGVRVFFGSPRSNWQRSLRKILMLVSPKPRSSAHFQAT